MLNVSFYQLLGSYNWHSFYGKRSLFVLNQNWPQNKSFFSLRKQNDSASFFLLFLINMQMNIPVRIQLDQQSKPALW